MQLIADTRKTHFGASGFVSFTLMRSFSGRSRVDSLPGFAMMSSLVQLDKNASLDVKIRTHVF